MSGQRQEKTKTQERVYWVLSWLLPTSVLKWFGGCLLPTSANYITVELTSIERAKMAYEHRWKLGEIFLDKGCFTILAGIVAGAVLILGNYFLEDYRSKEARERVLTEKRLEALTSISALHSQMIRTFFRFSHEDLGKSADQAAKEYDESIEELIHEINKRLPLLGKDFDKNVSWYLACHRQFKAIGVKKCGMYGTLASNLDNEFNSLCEAYLNKGKFPHEDQIVLKPIYREERVTMKPEEYIMAQVAYRKEHGKDDNLP